MIPSDLLALFMWLLKFNSSSRIKPSILGFLLYFSWWFPSFRLMTSLSILSLEKMHYSVFSLLSFILHWLLHVFIWFRSSCSLDSINFLFSSVCQIVASSANLQWSAVMLLNISLMKMLKRIGEITYICGRPILVWNHTPVWSFTIHLASRWLRNAFIQFHMFRLTPLLDSFTMSPSLHTLSNAFSKSINMAVFDFDMLKPLKMSRVRDKSALTVNLKCLSPSCSASSMWNFSTKASSLNVIILSIIFPTTLIRLIGL